jgi:tetratricopeptide (TPR) repeat protein
VFVVGGGLLGALLTNQVVIDQPSRTVTTSRRLLGFPLNTTAVPFREIANVEHQYYRQNSGRTSHDAWRVNVITRDNRRIPINWDGKQDEMATLAQKVAALTGGQLVDNSTRAVSTAQQILDSMPGRTDSPAPAAEETGPQEAGPQRPEPNVPDIQTPPPVAAPWLMPEDQSAQPPAPSASETTMETRRGAETARDLRNMAIPELEQRIKSDPMDGQGRHVLARKYQSNGQLNRAAALYQEVLHIDPTNVDAQNDLGVALEQQRKRTEAEAAYRRAVALDPFSSRAHLNLGLLLRAMNRAAEASQEFYQARQNARNDAESRLAEAASTGGKLEPQLSNIFQ